MQGGQAYAAYFTRDSYGDEKGEERKEERGTTGGVDRKKINYILTAGA